MKKGDVVSHDGIVLIGSIILADSKLWRCTGIAESGPQFERVTDADMKDSTWAFSYMERGDG